MTDTRREFEKAMRFSEEFRDGNIYQFSFMTAAWQSWQACQSLNDKRNKEWESALNAALEEKAQAKQDEETANKRIENYKSAYETWQDKTEWVQETSTAKELGLHRADVLKKRIEQLLAVIELQRNAMQEAVDCGMVPISSAKEGGAARYSQQVIVADKIRSALALQPEETK